MANHRRRSIGADDNCQLLRPSVPKAWRQARTHSTSELPTRSVVLRATYLGISTENRAASHVAGGYPHTHRVDLWCGLEAAADVKRTRCFGPRAMPCPLVGIPRPKLSCAATVVYIHTQEGVVLERNSRRLIQMLEQDGWLHVATKGSHRQFRHPTKRSRVTVPHPDKDIPLGTVASFYRQAGLDPDGG